MRDSADDDDVEVVPVALDRETLQRLAKFGQETGRHPLACASALLRDLLIDDERANIKEPQTQH